MSDLVSLRETPKATETYMIAGWRQWADAGSVSSELPRYLVDQTHARKIGEIKPDGFYLFQFPGTHHLLRPRVKLVDGHPEEMDAKQNDFFYSGQGERGLVLFLGEEPHQNEELYADAFFDAVEALGVKRVAAVGGVHGPMPYDKDREISCAYSLPRMKDDLSSYAVKFSNYEGGTTIGIYLAHMAEKRGVEFLVFNAFVPAYDFSQLSVAVEQIRIDKDSRAWYDIMTRLNHMFDAGLDLTDLRQQADDLTSSMHAKIDQLIKAAPQVRIKEYMDDITREFEEMPFVDLDDVWEDALRDILEDSDE